MASVDATAWHLTIYLTGYICMTCSMAILAMLAPGRSYADGKACRRWGSGMRSHQSCSAATPRACTCAWAPVHACMTHSSMICACINQLMPCKGRMHQCSTAQSICGYDEQNACRTSLLKGKCMKNADNTANIGKEWSWAASKRAMLFAQMFGQAHASWWNMGRKFSTQSHANGISFLYSRSVST